MRILFPLFHDRINGNALLQNGITTVFDIEEDSLDHAFAVSKILSIEGRILGLQHFGDGQRGFSRDVEVEDPLDQFGFFGDNFRFAVLTLAVSEHLFVLERDLSFLEVLAFAPCDILTDAFGFGLGKARIDNQVQFRVAFQRVDVLFFEQDADAARFEHSHIVQAFDGISCESGDRFGYDIVNLSGKAVLDHLFESRSLFCQRPRDTFVGVDVNETPILPRRDHVGIYFFLCFVTGQLFFRIG